MKGIILGATGLVGRKIRSIISERKPNISEWLFFVKRETEEGAGIGDEMATLKPLEDVFSFLDEKTVVISALDYNLAKEYIPEIRKKSVVIDHSKAFRLDPDVPLIVPEINGELIKSHKNLIASPNCTTIQLVLVLAPLRNLAEIERVFLVSFQSVSGAGRNGLEEYFYELEFLAMGEEVKKSTDSPFLFPIADNLIPQIGEFNEDGYCEEELKVINESRKILRLPELKITATTVRVPISIGHSLAVLVEFSSSVKKAEIIERLKKEPYLEVFTEDYPTPIMVREKDLVYVGRIREDSTKPNSFWFWIVADNLRRGAATNTVLILEELLKVVRL